MEADKSTGAGAGGLAWPTESAPGEDDLVVAARGLFKIYKEGHSETVALRGADVCVRRGEFVSLMGPSGSGKTTLLAILAGLSLPSAGEVVVDDRTCRNWARQTGPRCAPAGSGSSSNGGTYAPSSAPTRSYASTTPPERRTRTRSRSPG